MNINEFALRIKTKYPELKDVDDSLLVKRMIKKNPELLKVIDEEVSQSPVVEETISNEKPSLLKQVGTQALKSGAQIIPGMMFGYPGEKITEREEKAIKVTAPKMVLAAVSPVTALSYEALQQAQNLAVSKLKKEKYDPLAYRRLSELIPEDVAKEKISTMLPPIVPGAQFFQPKIKLKTLVDAGIAAGEYYLTSKVLEFAKKGLITKSVDKAGELLQKVGYKGKRIKLKSISEIANKSTVGAEYERYKRISKIVKDFKAKAEPKQIPSVVQVEVKILLPLKKEFGSDVLEKFIPKHAATLRKKVEGFIQVIKGSNQDAISKASKELTEWATKGFKEFVHVREVVELKEKIKLLKAPETKDIAPTQEGIEKLSKKKIKISKEELSLEQTKGVVKSYQTVVELKKELLKPSLKERIVEAVKTTTAAELDVAESNATIFQKTFEKYSKVPSKVREALVAIENIPSKIQPEAINFTRKIFGDDLIKDSQKMEQLAVALETNTAPPEGTEEVAANLKTTFNEVFKWHKEKGYLKRSYLDRTKEVLTDLLEDEKLPIETVKHLKERIEFLDTLRYVPVSMKPDEGMKGFIKGIAKYTKRKKLGVTIKKRETLTRKEAREAGLDLYSLFHSVSRLVRDFKEHQLLDSFVEAINANKDFSTFGLNSEFVTLDERIFPTSVIRYTAKDGKTKVRVRKYHPVIAECLNYLTEQSNSNALVIAYDRVNSTLKIMNFYILPMLLKNNIQQAYVRGGLKALVYLPKALIASLRNTKLVQEMQVAGVFNSPLNGEELIEESVDRMVDFIKLSKGERYLKNVTGWAKQPTSFVSDTWKQAQGIAWTYFDKVVRISTMMSIMDKQAKKGLTFFETAELVNRAHVPYAYLKNIIRRILNRAFLVPTYRIFTLHYMASILKEPFKRRSELFRLAILKSAFAFGIPAAASMIAYVGFNKKYDITVQGHQWIIKEKGKNDIIMSIASPFMEYVKLFLRHPGMSAYYNLAAIHKLAYGAIALAKGLDYPSTLVDRMSSLLPLGIPLVKDYLNWKSLDKNNYQKFLEQMGIVSFYETQHYKDPSSDALRVHRAIRALGYIPHWFKNKKMRELKNAHMAYKYYNNKIKLCLTEGDWDRLNAYKKLFRKRYGYNINITMSDYKRAVKGGIMKSLYTREEWYEKGLPRELRMHLKQLKEGK